MVCGYAEEQHELADCLWSVLVIAELYGVELEVAFQQTMTELDQVITTQLRQEEG
ncbi:hypothetical protein [Streptomyces roseolus]|uniref:hypothetical protein n=1 Tax=Streptomyces roseolus TaxID=67358 RepID=UPI00378E1DD8